MICKLSFALLFFLPVQRILKHENIQLGAIWHGLITWVFAYAGYRVGHAITRSICADENTSTLMAMEVFGAEVGIYAMVACVVSYLFSCHTGIYRSQRIGHAKHRHAPEGMKLGATRVPLAAVEASINR
jgi:hypothetical protein